MQNLNRALAEIDERLPPKQYIEKILQVTCDNLDYLFGTFIEVDDEGEAHMVASYDFPEIYPELVNKVKVPILSSPSGEAFETGKIVVLHDPFSDPRLKPWDNVRIIVGSLETMIWVPLFKKSRVFGIFVLYSDIRREISDQELSMLEQVGAMISIAITSNQYHDKLTQRTKELENGIAERKKNENKLQKMHDRLEMMVEERTSELSEANKKLQLFRYLINQSNDVIFVTDPQTALILDANEKACTSLGYSREELLSMKVIDFEMKDQDIDSWKDHVDTIMTGNCQIINESVYKRKDGTTFPVEVNVKLVTQNEKDYLVAVIHDMTKFKQAEEALWVSNEKYRSLTDDVLDSSAVGIFILDSHLRVVWVNHALEDYFGLKKNEIIGKDKRQLIRERIKDIFEDPDSFANKVFNTYDDNTYVEHFECHVLPNDERNERWLEHRSKPIQSGLYVGGRIEHYYDITERKQAEEKLKASEDKYSTLVEKGNDGIIIIQDFVLKFVNSKMIDFLGLTKEKVIGKQFSDYVSPEYKELVTENIKNRLKGKAIPSKYELDIISKDGSIIPVEISASIIEYEDKPANMAIIRDITERKRAGKELVDTKNYLDMIISMSYDGIMVVDSKGKFEFANNACCEISGYTKEEIINKPVLETISPEYTEFMINKWNEVQVGESGTYEMVMVKKDGTKKNLLISHSNVEINGQQKYVAVIKDITTDITEYINMIAETLKDQHED